MLRTQFGNIDIYLFDQLLKGRFEGFNSILDIGCGGGRNTWWFLKNGWEVFGTDPNPQAIEVCRMLAAQGGRNNLESNFKVGTAEAIPFQGKLFDLVVMNAVLHFAENEAHFDQMLLGAWSQLRPGGIFFARLATDIGLESAVQWQSGRIGRFPDGSVRFIASREMIADYTSQLQGELLDPVKTTNVDGLRCMTTWVMRKPNI